MKEKICETSREYLLRFFNSYKTCRMSTGTITYLHPITLERRPFSTIHIDQLGSLATTAKGYRYLLVVDDNLTKYVYLAVSRLEH